MIAIAVAALVTLTACGSSDEEGTDDVAEDGMVCFPAATEPTAEAPEVPAIETPPTEVETEDLEVGDGCAVGELPFANLNLIGATSDGTVFTDTWEAGRPLSIDPTSGALLPALASALVELEVGGIRRIALPAADAYGADGNEAQGIGPDEPLTFIVELISVTKDRRYCREAAPLPAGTRDGKPESVEIPVEVPTELETEDLEAGEGDPIEAGNFVRMEYVGVACSTGEQFDSSWDRDSTLDFTVGQGTIDGMAEGVIGAKPGALRRIVIPSDLGYGPQGTPDGSIAPNEALVFVIEIVEVLPEPPAETTTTTAAGDATTTTAAP